MPKPPSTTQQLTGDQNIDGVLSGHKWAGTAITYVFPTRAATYGESYGLETAPDNWIGPISTAAKTAALEAFDDLASFTNLTFAQGTNPNTATLRFAESKTAAPTAYAYYPGVDARGGDIWFSAQYPDYRNPKLGNYGQDTMWHEIGHALGLKHGHELDGQGSVAMTPDRDSVEFSIMTYRSYISADPGSGATNEEFGFPQSYMMYDIAALQEMYGANYETNKGNTVYTFSETTGEMFINDVGQGKPGNGNGGSSNRVFRTIWDGGGVDTYDFSNYHDGQDIDLHAGGWSRFSNEQLANLGQGEYARANLYNALMFHGSTKSLIENAVGGAGNDQIRGNEANNVLTGNAGDDRLYGDDGDDRLDGGAGNDRLDGGAGHDIATYASATAGVTANLTLRGYQDTGGAGEDLLISIESLIGSRFSDVLIGDAGSNMLTGGVGNDALYGGSGDDLLNGGSGNDVLDGGKGDDTATYASATVGVTVSLALAGIQDTGGAGKDTLVSIENLIGSKFNDRLTGDAGDNYLEGGDGDDILDGGAGSDTGSYDSAKAGVTVSLALAGAQNTGSAGKDTLISVENLTGSRFNDTLTGNAGANFLDGGAGDDRLDGGAGNDKLHGGAGNDILIGGDGNDTAIYATAEKGVTVSLALTGVQDTGGAGKDTLSSIENLIGSQFDDRLTGSNGANTLVGGDGDDTLSGGGGNDVLSGGNGDDTLIGGAGADTLTGGAGNDIFVFASASESTPLHRDTITDFGSGADKIDLSHIFDGTLSFIAGAFTGVAGQVHAVVSGADRLVEADLDGNGAADFAVLIRGALPLSASDFLL